MEPDQMTSTPSLGLTSNACNDLITVTRWAKFLSIMGFIGTGILFIGSILMFAFSSLIPNMGQMPQTPMLIPFKIISFVYLGMSILYFFISLYMYQFATKTSTAITLTIDSELEMGMKYLRKQYTLIGITTIVMIALTILIFIIGVIASIAAAAMI